jgi:hypothetical protein
MRSGTKTLLIVLGTAVVVTAAPAVARTVVDFARNAGHVDGFRAVDADTPATKRGGAIVATDEHGHLPNDIIRRAPDSAELGGLPPDWYQQVCDVGTIAGFAQVPGDIGSQWTVVDGYGRSVFSIGASRSGGPSTCRPEQSLARRISTGVYQVSLNSSLAWACTFSEYPRQGQALPALLTVTSSAQLVATYTTLCDSNDKGFVEQVRIAKPDGTPIDADFTLAALRPVVVVEP